MIGKDSFLTLLSEITLDVTAGPLFKPPGSDHDVTFFANQASTFYRLRQRTKQLQQQQQQQQQ